MSPADLLATVPPWLLLAVLLGGLLGAAYKCVRPHVAPGLLACSSLFTLGLGIGHLLALVGELPSWQLGDLRLLPGLAIGILLVAVARPRRV